MFVLMVRQPLWSTKEPDFLNRKQFYK